MLLELHKRPAILHRSSPSKTSSALLFLGIFVVLFNNILIPPCHCQQAVITTPRKTYMIASILDSPFLMEKTDQNKTLRGNERYEGFAKDLADILSEKMGFSYVFDVSSKSYGQRFRRNGSWTGIIELLRTRNRGEGQPQFAIGPITITRARSEEVVFSTPFMEFQFALLMKKQAVEVDSDHKIGGYKDPHVVIKVKAADNDDDDDDDDNGSGDDDDDDEVEDTDGEDIGQYVFLRPMTVFLWIVFILSILLTVGLIFGVEKVISQKWSAAQEEVINRERAPDSKVTILPKPVGLCTNGIIGSPRTTAGRFLQIIFWIYLAIFVAAYIATFSADRIVDELNDSDEEEFDPESLQPKVNTIEELASQDEIDFAFLYGGSTYEYFSHTTNPKLRKANSIIFAKDIIIRSINEGVKRVRDGNGSFVFIMEEPTARAKAGERPCDLIVSSEKFGPKLAYGVALSKAADLPPDFIRNMNLHLLELKETEQLEALEKKWYEDRSKCFVDPSKNADDDDDDDNGNGDDGKDDDDDSKENGDDDNDNKDDNDNDEDEDEEDEEDLALTVKEMAGAFYILVAAIIIALVVAIVEIFMASKNTIPQNSSPRDEPKGIELTPQQRQVQAQQQQQQQQPTRRT